MARGHGWTESLDTSIEPESLSIQQPTGHIGEEKAEAALKQQYRHSAVGNAASRVEG